MIKNNKRIRLYEKIENEYKKACKKKNFDETKFNLYIEKLTRKKYPISNKFYVVNDSCSNIYHSIRTQAYKKSNFDEDKMYETEFGLLCYPEENKKAIIREGFLTCEDIKYNLNVKRKVELYTIERRFF